MKFLLLGPLTVRLHDRDVQVSAPRQRVVLATLLLNANHVVSVERIARYVWDGVPPPSAAATVRTYVMRLRQALGEQAAARIVTRAPGYLIGLDEQESDLGQFTAHRRRAACLAESGIWRAPPRSWRWPWPGGGTTRWRTSPRRRCATSRAVT